MDKTMISLGHSFLLLSVIKKKFSKSNIERKACCFSLFPVHGPRGEGACKQRFEGVSMHPLSGSTVGEMSACSCLAHCLFYPVQDPNQRNDATYSGRIFPSNQGNPIQATQRQT